MLLEDPGGPWNLSTLEYLENPPVPEYPQVPQVLYILLTPEYLWDPVVQKDSHSKCMEYQDLLHLNL
jgi:hypothetical protein